MLKTLCKATGGYIGLLDSQGIGYSGFKEGIIILTLAKYLKLSIINDRI